MDKSIKRFELTFELAWKTMQDYLQAQGYVEHRWSRKVIGKSYQDDLITDGDLWFLMLEDRNTLTHVYDYDKSRSIYEKIAPNYIVAIEQLYKKLKDESAK